jgi:hypothetical protein
MSITNYLENEWIKHIFGGTAYTDPVSVHLALGTAADDTGITGEPSTGNYARAAISCGAAAARAISNDVAITFPQASGDWGTMTHWVIFDAATTGNPLAWGTINGGTGTAVNTNDTASMAIGQIVVTVGGGGFSSACAHLLLDHTFDSVAYSQPATWAAMGTGYTDGSAGTEAAGGNYARTTVAAWTLASNNAQNTAAITFPTPLTADWTGGPQDQIIIYDASTSGGVLAYGAVAPSITPLTDDTVEIPINGFNFTITD